jgi:hypothetical protein
MLARNAQKISSWYGARPILIRHCLLQEPHVWQISNARKLVVYCLGTLENPLEKYMPYKDNPLYQLAFSGILRDMMPMLEGPPEFYDPGFNAVDRAVLEHLGYTV